MESGCVCVCVRVVSISMEKSGPLSSCHLLAFLTWVCGCGVGPQIYRLFKKHLDVVTNWEHKVDRLRDQRGRLGDML